MCLTFKHQPPPYDRTGEVPQQHNGCDCGVFMSTFANYLRVGREDFDFTQRDMPYMRRRIGVDVLQGSITQG